MATVNVLNQNTGRQYSINVTLERGILADSGVGTESYYVRVMTSQTDVNGQAVPSYVLKDEVFTPGTEFTMPIEEYLVAIMDAVSGGEYLSSSSSLSSIGFSSASSLGRSTSSSLSSAA